jgi:hypothetical protein
MLQEKRGAWAALLVISLFFLGLSLFINLPVIHQGFLFADQAVYYAMAQSLAFDRDLEYTKKDLVRYIEDFNAGPNGIFLKRVIKNGTERLYFAKNFAYPLFAAPFVRVFGTNGPLALQAILLFLILLMGKSYFSLGNSPGLSLLRVLTFLFASVAGVYFFWIAPDFFNLFLVFTVLFLWLYKHRAGEIPIAGPGVKAGRLRSFLLSEKSDYLASFIAGIAVFSKPPNIAVMGPFLLWHLVRKKFAKTTGLFLLFILGAGLFFSFNAAVTSDWNYQGGERKSFYFTFPYEREGISFDTAEGQKMTTDNYFTRFLLPPKFILINVFYYLFGRFTGVMWYFFPACLFLILFVLGKKSLERWLLLAALAGEILIYIILMPQNFGGGGGSLANRYFLNIYPFFLFLPGLKIRRGEIILSWAVAALLISQILVCPFQASAHPSTHAKKFPFTLFPVELTLINDLPTNTEPPAFRQKWGNPPAEDRFLYFLNDNFNEKHPTENGWWTLGDRKADIVLRTFFPVKEVVFHLQNNPRLSNEITVSVDGRVQRIVLGSKQNGDLRFSGGNGFQVRQSHQYRIKVQAAKGSMPYYESRESDERRWLGVFFELELVAK